MSSLWGTRKKKGRLDHSQRVMKKEEQRQEEDVDKDEFKLLWNFKQKQLKNSEN